MYPASYKRCASVIVFLTLKPIRVLAACCNVEVIKGAEGFELVLRDSRSVTENAASRIAATAASASASFLGSNFSPPLWVTMNRTGSISPDLSRA